MFNPVVNPTTIHIILSLALTNNWEIRQLDVNNAFLNSYLQEKVYMAQPRGLEIHHDPPLVCELHKALYGLRQAPRAWFIKLNHRLLSLGFTPAKSDQSLFLRFTTTSKIYLLVYIDDILITRTDPNVVHHIVHQLNNAFALIDLGPLHLFLGILVTHLPNGSLHLSQQKYILDHLARTEMQYARSATTPMTK